MRAKIAPLGALISFQPLFPSFIFPLKFRLIFEVRRGERRREGGKNLSVISTDNS